MEEEEKSIRQKLLSAHLRDFAVPPPLTTQQGFVLRKYLFFGRGRFPLYPPLSSCMSVEGKEAIAKAGRMRRRGGKRC